MPPPSQLVIGTNSLKRLIKEEASYHKELEQEEAEIKALKDKIESGQGDENAEFMLKQQQTALEQTKAVFEPLRERIAAAAEKLEEQITAAEEDGGQDLQIQQAKEALAQSKATQNGV
ncbi:hypothetical protein FDECE_9687 [Fusarium decemcellulare]|nr:hypothetical protein FDECE_9687 [Fusarium decemcellulare]